MWIKIYIVASSLQLNINAYMIFIQILEINKIDTEKLKKYKSGIYIYKNNDQIYQHSKHALECIQGPPVYEFDVLKMKCVLLICKQYPTFKPQIEGSNLRHRYFKIAFQVFQNIYKFSIHHVLDDDKKIL